MSLRAVEALADRASRTIPVLVALADATTRYPVPPTRYLDLVADRLMDAESDRCRSWEELRCLPLRRGRSGWPAPPCTRPGH